MGRRGVLSVLFSALVVATAGFAVTAKDATKGKTVKLDQNADPAALQRYYHTDQGSWLIPAAWLDALVDDSGRKVMAPENMKRLGFLIDDVAPSKENPYGWPVGFTISDPAKSGGIPMAGLSCAACHTGQIEHRGTSVRIDGGQSMIDLGGFVGVAVKALASLVENPAKRKAFIEAAVANGYPAARVEADFAKAAEPFKSLGQAATGGPVEPVSGRGRYDAVQGIANQVFGGDIQTLANIKPRMAPVSYPPLWDIWRLSWLQYNAFIPRSPQSRNIGEAIGVRAQTHIIDPETGALNPEPLRWRSSIQFDNQIWMEDVLKTLHAPKWPADVLGPINKARAAEGRKLFAQNCAGCHGIKELPDGAWDVTVVPLEHIGTDPAQATNWAGLTYDATKIGLSSKTPAYKLDVAINAVRKQLYADNKTPPEKQEPDVELLAPCGYKARPLIGIWASPPFLHNGSVRTVFDLLSETRPAKFTFGTREFDTAKLGYTQDKSDGDLVFDSSAPGNSNQGHWWTNDKTRPGRIGPRLSNSEKYAIIEYLKVASYDDYPTEKRAAPATMPCEADKEWALKRTR